MNDIDWLGNWKRICDSDYQIRLAAELRREIESNPRHVLYGADVTFLAEYVGSREKDFIVFVLPRAIFAKVHLTYSAEHDPRWPWCTVIGGRTELIRYLERDLDDDD